MNHKCRHFKGITKVRLLRAARLSGTRKVRFAQPPNPLLHPLGSGAGMGR